MILMGVNSGRSAAVCRSSMPSHQEHVCLEAPPESKPATTGSWNNHLLGFGWKCQILLIAAGEWKAYVFPLISKNGQKPSWMVNRVQLKTPCRHIDIHSPVWMMEKILKVHTHFLGFLIPHLWFKVFVVQHGFFYFFSGSDFLCDSHCPVCLSTVAASPACCQKISNKERQKTTQYYHNIIKDL